jgi:predicted RNA methylase
MGPQEKRKERLGEVADRLRIGRSVTDFRFDQVYPPEIRSLSEVHWTPVGVARRAAELLVNGDQTQVLDVGSGVGKFCIVGALASRGHFIGVEQRPHLLEVARKAAQELSADRATFVSGQMEDLNWSLYDAFYLYNPFYENRRESIRIDSTVFHSEGEYDRLVEVVRAKLKAARVGTRIATYHGFGGEVPLGYECVRREPIGTSYLEVWVKIGGPKIVQKRYDENLKSLV